MAKDIENYGIVKVTEKGHAFLKKPSSIKFTRDHDYSNAESDFDEDDDYSKCKIFIYFWLLNLIIFFFFKQLTVNTVIIKICSII